MHIRQNVSYSNQNKLVQRTKKKKNIFVQKTVDRSK